MPSDKSSQVNNDTPVRILHAQLDSYYAHHDNKINDIINVSIPFSKFQQNALCFNCCFFNCTWALLTLFIINTIPI